MSEKKATEKQFATIRNYKETFNTPAGRKVLRDMMSRFGFLRPTAVINDPYSTYFNDGQRAVVIHILRQMKMPIEQMEEQLEKILSQKDNE